MDLGGLWGHGPGPTSGMPTHFQTLGSRGLADITGDRGSGLIQSSLC